MYSIWGPGSHLRLYNNFSLPVSFSVHCSALKSLHINIDSTTTRGALRVSDCLHLLPQLSELTYLQIHCSSELIVSHPTADTDPVELHTELPQSLPCLSLLLRST